MYLDSSILWWVEAYNWSIWEEKWCSHTSYSRRFVMSLFRDYTFQYGLLRCCWCYYKTSPFWVRERRGKENWTKKDMSCYAAFLSYFSSGWRSPLLWTILIPNEVRKKNKRRIWVPCMKCQTPLPQMKMDVSPLVNLFCSSSRPYLYCMCKMRNYSLLKKSHSHGLKITQNVSLEFWHFPPFFVWLKLTCL